MRVRETERERERKRERERDRKREKKRERKKERERKWLIVSGKVKDKIEERSIKRESKIHN